MDDRFVWKDDDIIMRIDCKGLTCENCAYKIEDMPGLCPIYDPKPRNVLHGGECDKKILKE